MKEDFRAELWKNQSVIKKHLDKIREATDKSSIMQMVDADNIELLDAQNTDWRFIKFLPQSTIDWFKDMQQKEKDKIIDTEQSETAGYIRFIPLNKASMDVVNT